MWDDIINRDKAIALNKEYKYRLNVSAANAINVPITQVISDIERFITKTYPDVIFSVTPIEDEEASSGSGGSAGESLEKEDKYAKAEYIVDQLVKLEHKLIPAADAIINADLVNKTDTIINNLDAISGNVSIIARNIG